MPRRRILICNYEFPPLGGGGGTCSLFLARELARLGHQVEVVTAHWGKLERVLRHGNLTVRRIRALRRRAGQSNPVEMLAYVAAAVPYLLLRGGPKPHVLVSFHSIPSGLAAWPLSVLWGVPHITLFRGGDVPGWLPGELARMHRYSLWLNRLIVYQSAAALANSEGLRDLAQPSFPRKPVGVLTNGVDPRRYHPPKGGRAGRSGPVRLLFVGRITTQKGLDVLLRALAHASVAGLSWHLDVGGDGPQLETYRALAASLGLASRVTFHGWLSREGVQELYDKADVLTFPSRYEGMPNVVLESMACGLPVIGTRIAGTVDLVEHGVTGLMMDVDDEATLAVHLRTMVLDGELRERFGAEARRRIVEHWSWAARARQFEEIVEDCLAHRG